jgi:hypothetical protein
MPGANRECSEDDGKARDEYAGPADQRLVGGEAREGDGDPGGQERDSGGKDDPALAELGEPAEYERERTASVNPKRVCLSRG